MLDKRNRGRRAAVATAIAAGCVLMAGFRQVSPPNRASSGAGQDGRIYFDSDRSHSVDIYSMKPNGAGVRRLTRDPHKDAQPALSGSGRRIAFVSNRSGQRQIFGMRADGSHVRRLTHGSGIDDTPSYSDTGKIVFEQYRPTTGIYVMNGDGSHLHQLPAPIDASKPVVSPDGSMIAFVRTVATGTFDIFTMDLNGANLQRVTHGGRADPETPPAFSSDQRKLVFTGRDPHSAQIVRLDGSHRHAVGPPGSATGLAPVFSPSGRSIAFFGHGPGGHYDILTMRADGSHVRPRTNACCFNENPDWAQR